MTELVTSTIIAILGVLTTAAGSIISWRIAKRKNNAEAKITEINADSLSASLYQNLLDDARRIIAASIETIKERDITIDNLIKANKEREATIESLTKAAKERDDQIEHLMDKIDLLTSELKKNTPLNS